MNEWVKGGTEIAARSDTDPKEKAEIEAWVKVMGYARDRRQAAGASANDTEKATKPDLRTATYELLSQLREPLPEEREALKGYLYFPISAKSLAQVMADDRAYFEYVYPLERLRSYTLPGDFVVAVNPQMLRLPNSNNSSQAKQLRMTGEYSKKSIEPLAPHAKAIMLPATALAQMDIAYQKGHQGEKLFLDFWVCALDEAVSPRVALVGRGHPVDRLHVDGWYADDGFPRVWALPAVVFV